MSAYPNPKRVLYEITRLERYVDDLGMIPSTRYYRSAVILALLSKALTVARAICSLVESGFPAEAFGLSRTLMEIYFCLRYIGNKDTENRAKTYVNYHARVRQEWRSIIMKYYPNTPSGCLVLDEDVLQAAREFKSKAHWTGSGGQAKLMALEPDEFEKDEHAQPEKSEFDYEALYFWTSHFVHVTVDAVEAHASEPGEVFRVRGRSELDRERGDDALFNTLIFLNKSFIRACRAMNEEQPEILEDIHKLSAEFAKKAP